MILESGRGQLVIAAHSGKTWLTISVNGSGYTIALEQGPAIDASAEIRKCVRMMRRK